VKENKSLTLIQLISKNLIADTGNPFFTATVAKGATEAGELTDCA